MNHPPTCRPHPDSKVCMVLGDHLYGCTLQSCAGCRACERHPSPAVVAASRAALVAAAKAIPVKRFELDEREES